MLFPFPRFLFLRECAHASVVVVGPGLRGTLSRRCRGRSRGLLTSSTLSDCILEVCSVLTVIQLRCISTVYLYRNIVSRDILLSLCDRCGRSQVVSEAGAWSLARADPFLPKQLLPVAVKECLADGGDLQWKVPWGPPGLGGLGPCPSPQFSHSPCCSAALLTAA